MILALKRAVIIPLALGVCVIVAAWSDCAQAMDFLIKQAPDGDYYVLAKGDIVGGERHRFKRMLMLTMAVSLLRRPSTKSSIVERR
jgi:hypothetical protein